MEAGAGVAEAEGALRSALQFMNRFGYSDDLVEVNYTVWMGGDAGRADAVLFARSLPKDITTTAAVLEVQGHSESRINTRERAATLARELAAPLIAIASSNSLELSLITFDGTISTIADLDYINEHRVDGLRESISPRALLEAKTAPRQPGLFPVDVRLLENARARSTARLTPRIEAALHGAHSLLVREDSDVDGARLNQNAARLVAGALTALVTRDKEGLKNLTPGALADALLQKYPDQYGWLTKLPSREYDAFTGVVSGLGGDVDFRSLDPAILSEVYERALISETTRRETGTHYTPPEMARRILAGLPVEELEPGSRSVMDPACGSGGLLLAAHDRLRSLQPLEWDTQLSHRVLSEQLHGYDVDPFAVEIARLSMLLHAAPAGNGWDIRNEDALQTTRDLADKPSIIVANPPWRNASRGGKRTEIADDFVLWALRNIRPNGLIAIVLPSSWLDRPSNRKVRSSFREHADIFETWRLPKGIFHGANAGCSVVFARAQEKVKTPSPVLAKRVMTLPEIDRFWESGQPSESFLASPKMTERADTLAFAPTTSWASANNPPSLSEVAHVVAGPQPKLSLKTATPGGNALYMNLAGDLEPLTLVNESKMVKVHFPDDFQSARGAAGLDREKVLVPAVSGPDTPWRLRAGLDLSGILVRNSMHMIIPTQENVASVYAIMALLSSTFASCWIDELALDRNISTRDIASLPIPDGILPWRTLDKLGRQLIESKGYVNESSTVNTVRSLLMELDEVVYKSVEVPEWIQRRQIERVQGIPSPEGIVRYLPSGADSSETNIATAGAFGSIIDINESGEMLIFVNGCTPDEGVWVRPPSRMPGALCRIGATFDVLLNHCDIATGRFNFQPAAWMQPSDLIRELDRRVEESPHSPDEVRLGRD